MTKTHMLTKRATLKTSGEVIAFLNMATKATGIVDVGDATGPDAAIVSDAIAENEHRASTSREESELMADLQAQAQKIRRAEAIARRKAKEEAEAKKAAETPDERPAALEGARPTTPAAGDERQTESKMEMDMTETVNPDTGEITVTPGANEKPAEAVADLIDRFENAAEATVQRLNAGLEFDVANKCFVAPTDNTGPRADPRDAFGYKQVADGILNALHQRLYGRDGDKRYALTAMVDKAKSDLERLTRHDPDAENPRTWAVVEYLAALQEEEALVREMFDRWMSVWHTSCADRGDVWVTWAERRRLRDREQVATATTNADAAERRAKIEALLGKKTG